MISLYGVYPPNIGGVSVHMDRLRRLLNGTNLLSKIYVNNHARCLPVKGEDLVDISCKKRWNIIRKMIYFFKTIRKDSADILHIHGSVIWDYIYVILFIRFCKGNVVFTVHDMMQLERPQVYLQFVKVLYKHVNPCKLRFVAVNSKIASQLNSIGIKQNRISVIPAFLQLQKSACQYIVDKSRYNILWYAPGLHSSSDNTVYRLDKAIELLDMAIKNGVKAHLYICIPNGYNSNVYNSIVDGMELSQSISLITNPFKNMNDILSVVDLYFRPTSTDGDSILIRDALCAGCHVLCSDVVPRPSACELFSLENSDMMKEKFLEIQENKSNNSPHTDENYFEELLKVYKSFYK